MRYRGFGVDAAFDRVAADDDIVLIELELFAGGNPDLFAHKVGVRHQLGDRMLDLYPRVHLHEVKVLCSSSRNSIVPALT